MTTESTDLAPVADFFKLACALTNDRAAKLRLSLVEVARKIEIARESARITELDLLIAIQACGAADGCEGAGKALVRPLVEAQHVHETLVKIMEAIKR